MTLNYRKLWKLVIQFLDNLDQLTYTFLHTYLGIYISKYNRLVSSLCLNGVIGKIRFLCESVHILIYRDEDLYYPKIFLLYFSLHEGLSNYTSSNLVITS